MTKLHPVNIPATANLTQVMEIAERMKVHGKSNDLPEPHTVYSCSGVSFTEGHGTAMFFSHQPETWKQVVKRLLPELKRLERFHAPYKGPTQIWVVSRNMESGPLPAKWKVIGLIGSGAEGVKLNVELNKPWPDTYKVEPIKVYGTAEDFLKEVQT
jgi:hypothetical protein